VIELVFLLEEPSARYLLEGLIPRIISREHMLRFIVFQGKQDLEKRMTKRLRAWGSPSAKFVVLRDQDSGNCIQVKNGLVERCNSGQRPNALVRVACRELESWIVGDLVAFADEFSVPAARRAAGKKKFSSPDNLVNPVTELEKLFPCYQKVDGARRMGLRLSPDQNNSISFKIFCKGIQDLVKA